MCLEPRGSFSNDSLSRQTINTNDSSSSPSPSFFSFLPQLLFHPLVSTSQTPVSLCLHLSFPLCLHTVPTSPPLCLAPESWHTGGCRCVTRQLTPPTPLQSMCITAKHNGELCECHQYAAEGDVVTLQTTWSINLHTFWGYNQWLFLSFFSS